ADHQHDEEDHDPAADVGDGLGPDEIAHRIAHIGQRDECDDGGDDPAGERQQLLDEAPRHGEQARECEDAEDREIEPVHRAPFAGAGRRCVVDRAPRSALSNSATNSPRWPISRRTMSASPGSRGRRRGMIAAPKPSLAASFSRLSIWLTGRTSPDNPISPKITVSAGTGQSLSEDSKAAATARSAAGSCTLRPPA